MQRCLVILSQLDQTEVLLGMAAQALTRIRGMQRIDVLAAREPPEQILGRIGFSDTQAQTLRAKQREWADALHTRFQQWLAQEYGTPADRLGKVEVNWLDPEITVDRIIAGYGKDADLLILGFPDSRDSAQKHVATRAAIFESGRPVLFVPPFWEQTSGNRMFMAWKDTPACRRAFFAARSFVGAAEAVEVAVSATDPLPLDILPGVTLTQQPVVESHNAGQTLLDMAGTFRADMLVIGGYQHNMLYSRLMGSVTDYILANPRVPVLLQH
ncbi:universal stress protein [Acetobacter fabarum]|uniref:universal stress protein n=1 Tax=Acetobacter fabarum TaxID=483199 RepID=UPI00209D1195|nr:universal stress protein [Acetobacter fabarum]MCP1226820.1 universal stress protein [Acetobacter fabarum]MCP1232333.1 universal stress protein [Acetobacter fabarum]